MGEAGGGGEAGAGGNDLEDDDAGGPATSACLYYPGKLAFDRHGHLYIGDSHRTAGALPPALIWNDELC